MKNQRNKCDWQGMLIATILMIIGLIIIISFIKINVIEPTIIIFSLFFILVGIYCWYLYFRNIIIKPKKEILYLVNKEDKIYEFTDKKGKKYFYKSENEYEINKFYLMLKSNDSILKMISQSEENFKIPKLKESYWLNFYSPIGNFENIFLLPIVYIILLISILNLITFKTIFSPVIIMTIVSIYLIVYDSIYKSKKNKNEIIEDTKMKSSFPILINSIKIIILIVTNILLLSIFYKIEGIIFKIIFLPFVICGISILGESISIALNKKTLVKIFRKIYTISFLCYWFGIVIIGTYISIINKEYTTIIFLIPFWIVGIWVIKKNTKKITNINK